MAPKDAKSPPAKQPPTNKQTSGLLPAIQPISQLQTSESQTFSQVHTALLPLLFIARFSAIVADPVPALTQLVIPIAILQGLYCAVCLPPSSGTASAGSKKQKQAQKPAGWPARIVPTLISLTSSILLAPPLLFALLIAHGAPITSHLQHTALLAVHLSLLTTPGLFYTRGLRAESWRQIVSLAAPFDAVQGAAVGGVLGTWLGAIPIPLDWDREWQKWPVTVVAGAYVGSLVGKVGGGTLAWGKAVDFA